MGRKCAFDRESALQGALGAFWQDGYDKTSLEDLLSSMKIKTSSFYHSFESKEALFFEVLQYYRQSFGRERLSYLLSEDISGVEALRKYFEHLIFRNGKSDFPAGCFMMKTAANLSDPESNVGREVANSISKLEAGFESALQRSLAAKEIKKDIDIKATAKLLMSVAYGLTVLSRTKKSKKELLNTANAFIDMLVKS